MISDGVPTLWRRTVDDAAGPACPPLPRSFETAGGSGLSNAMRLTCGRYAASPQNTSWPSG